MNSVQLFVILLVELIVKINSGVSEYWEIFQILIFPRGLPTSALQTKLIDWFSSRFSGNAKNFSGNLAIKKLTRLNYEIDWQSNDLNDEHVQSIETSLNDFYMCFYSYIHFMY